MIRWKRLHPFFFILAKQKDRPILDILLTPSILQVGLLRRHSVLFSHTSCVFRGIKGLPTTQSRVYNFSLFFFQIKEKKRG